MHSSIFPGLLQSYVGLTWPNAMRIHMLIWVYTTSLNLKFCHRICIERSAHLSSQQIFLSNQAKNMINIPVEVIFFLYKSVIVYV